MKILIAMERSGILRDEFIRLGHEAYSCDLEPGEGEGPHIQRDVRGIELSRFDMMIAHPDCTYMCSSGLHWNNKTPGREAKTFEALEMVRFLMNAPIEKIAVENPVGRIGTAIRPADQYIQPYEFSEDASKRTGLWLKNLPPLIKNPDDYVPGREIINRNGKKVLRWANQTDSGQNKLAPSKTRAMDRARTYKGIAQAIAKQWG